MTRKYKRRHKRPERMCKPCKLKFRKSKTLRYHNKHNHGGNVKEYDCHSGGSWHVHYSEVAYCICSGNDYYESESERAKRLEEESKLPTVTDILTGRAADAEAESLLARAREMTA